MTDPHRARAPLVAALSALLALGATTPFTSAMIEQDASKHAEEEVLAVIRAFNDAFEANDADAYFRHIDDDIVVLTPSSPYRVEGLADDRAEFEWGVRSGRARVGYFQELQPSVRVYGDIAVATYYSRGSYGPDQTVAYLKETDVLVRRGDGWKITHIHVSSTSR